MWMVNQCWIVVSLWMKSNKNKKSGLPSTSAVCVCASHLPVLRVWCGHGSGYITHLEWYAPPVALQRQGGLGRRAQRVRKGGDGSAAKAGRFRRGGFPSDLWHGGPLSDVRCCLAHVFDCAWRKERDFQYTPCLKLNRDNKVEYFEILALLVRVDDSFEHNTHWQNIQVQYKSSHYLTAYHFLFFTCSITVCSDLCFIKSLMN